LVGRQQTVDTIVKGAATRKRSKHKGTTKGGWVPTTIKTVCGGGVHPGRENATRVWGPLPECRTGKGGKEGGLNNKADEPTRQEETKPPQRKGGDKRKRDRGGKSVNKRIRGKTRRKQGNTDPGV